MSPHVRRLSVSAAALMLGACVSLGAHREVGSGYGQSVAASTVGDCTTLLGRSTDEVANGFADSQIDILLWNIKKGSEEAWQHDLRNLAADKEIVILQEVVMDTGIEHELKHLGYESFSRGFRSRSQTTGVATYSALKPRSECRFAVAEPILRTAKATNIAEFGIAGREDTLLVVNVHAVNFSLGLGRFREQLAQAAQVMTKHDGPVIFSGDFNTWSRKRMAVVSEVAAGLELSPVAIREDYRKTFNGLALDHVFVRGLSVAGSETTKVTSSDHNPITVELRL